MTIVTEEQLIAKKKYAGEKKASMKRRDDYHDYTERRMYMITLEVEGRKPVFGHLVGNPFAERGSCDEPRIELSELGKAVQSEWLGIHGYFPQIEVMAVQMMPDHMHGILFVKAPLPVHLGQVISGFKAGCRKAQKALEAAGRAAAEPLPTEKRPLSAEKGTGERDVLASLQGAALPLQEGLQPYFPLFAKGYNDLILRSYDELPKWQNYLQDNPRRLLMKRTRPDWLRPFFGLHIGSHCYSGIGNRNLLAVPKRMAVRVSRRLSDSEITREVARFLEAAKQGSVLVSPAISPGEKRVMRAAFDAGLPTIVIMENGFTPLSKPHGEQFDACAKGQLLMLAPWEHHNEKKKITAAQCRQLNLMALEISEKA
ncbi:MAG: hypothetical protein IJT97_05590 [Bacteroidaceae bacterium]|nr:hypothetical protein [Bacteroidaceae bacterium]